MARHRYSDEIADELTFSDFGTFTVTLGEGQTAWDPDRAAGLPITGPARIVYSQHNDGSITATTTHVSPTERQQNG